MDHFQDKNILTYILPNYFIENKIDNFIKIDNLYCLNNFSVKKNNFVSFRTIMHCMILVLNGKKLVHFENNITTINSNEICFLSQNNYFMSEQATQNLSYEVLIIFFDDNFIFELKEKYNISINTTLSNNIIKINYHEDILFKKNIDLLKEYLTNNIDNNLLKLKVEEIFLHSLRNNNNKFSSFINSILQTSKDRIKYIIESNIDMIQTLDDMCNITRLTQNQLRRYIKKTYNLTPKVFIDTKRLEKATILLKNTNKTISDIATDCGYSTLSWFISQFKKYYNQTPKEFRYNK